jgi:predicted nucleic acid-binding protein
VYFDTSFIAKFYFNEPESPRVRELVRKADVIHSSRWALAELHTVLHRHVREGAWSPKDARELSLRFSEHIEDGLWHLIPVNEALLRRTSALVVSGPPDLLYAPPTLSILRLRRKLESAPCGPMPATCSLRLLTSA